MSDSVTRATITDVAHAAGVSRAAVSKVIRGAYGVSEDMRNRVEAAIDTLAYRPLVAARGMRGATYTIGMELPDIANQFFGQVLAGATGALDAEPYQLILAPADPTHQEGYRAIQSLVDRQVDGILAISPLAAPAWLETTGRTIPLVMLGRHDPSRHYDTVAGDDVRGATLLMEHLFAQGHRNIAHLTHEDFITQRGSGTPHSLRLATYESAMRSAGLGDRIRIIRCEAGEDSACVATREVLAESGRPTAIFAGHDELAIGVLRAVGEAGLDATDVAVVGYDNTNMASHPLISLTSIDQSGEFMGRRVIELLLERFAGRTEPVHVRTTPRLIVRASSSAPSAGQSLGSITGH